MATQSHGNAFSTGEHPEEGALLVKRRANKATKIKPAPHPDHIAEGLRPGIQLEAETIDIGTAIAGKPRDRIVISRPKFERAEIGIRGTTPLVLHKFSQKVQNSIRSTQEAGSQSRKGKTREARDFEANYEAAKHVSREGWLGIPASAFRNAMISACRTVGFKMTIAKMSLFCVADGFDEQGTGLVRITSGECHMDVRPGRNANGGIDLRSRPMWPEGWTATLTLRWDADQFSANDLVNLLYRAGQQVGVGEGRPDSKMSAGCGWGEFEVVTE